MTVLKQSNLHTSQKKGVYEHPYYKSIIRRSLNYLSAGYPVHYTGPSGVGKTTLAIHVAKLIKRPVTLITGNKDLTNEDLIGAYRGYSRKKLNDNFIKTVRKIEENVTEDWVEGHLYEAVKNGHTVVYDEFTRSSPDTNNLFLSVLEERVLPLYGSKTKDSHLRVHPDFRMVFTSNPAEYIGVYDTQDALMDRMISIPLNFISMDAEIAVVMERTGVDRDKAEAVVRFIRNVNQSESGKGPDLSVRSSIMIADIAEKTGVPIEGKNESFQNLCMDITYFSLLSSTNDEKEARNRIIEQCKKI
ncbi:gas vesicle protein GvpN [Halobacillus karajensis]|uniref:gas vesicle protein GvpN n=1 Tax=Halobacillus karajensis TaxID=195088 RepID=UPI0008A80DB9|nr:gas vesicle protein GvpN [Halobacillus karajensis]SEH40621.1 gas vesicle protein GvpN [Halobacillus karajensis]